MFLSARIAFLQLERIKSCNEKSAVWLNAALDSCKCQIALDRACGTVMNTSKSIFAGLFKSCQSWFTWCHSSHSLVQYTSSAVVHISVAISQITCCYCPSCGNLFIFFIFLVTSQQAVELSYCLWYCRYSWFHRFIKQEASYHCVKSR